MYYTWYIYAELMAEKKLIYNKFQWDYMEKYFYKIKYKNRSSVLSVSNLVHNKKSEFMPKKSEFHLYNIFWVRSCKYNKVLCKIFHKD